MEKIIEEYYRDYQKNSDKLVLESYYKLMAKSHKGDSKKVNDRIIAIKKVIKERNLRVKEPTKSNPNISQKEKYNKGLKDAVKAFSIGVFIFIVCLYLMEIFDGNKLFLVGTIIGAIKILQGIITGGVVYFFKLTDKS